MLKPLRAPLGAAFLLLNFLSLGSCSTRTQAPRDSESSLLLISLDGMRPEDVALAPHLVEFARQGVRAAGLKPVFPTLTFPNHFTQVTGRYPEHHGIVGNTMQDAKLGRFSLGDDAAVDTSGWWQADPIWNTVQRQGRVAATMFWPGSSAQIMDMRPSEWQPFDSKVSADQRVAQVLAWLDRPIEKRPNFMTLYFEHADAAQHRYGPGSPEAIAAIQELDAKLGALFAGIEARQLWDKMNIVIVSDHGMAATSPKRTVLLPRYLNPADGEVVMTGALSGINVKLRAPKSTAPQELIALREQRARILAKRLKRMPHVQVWARQDMPPRFHYRANPRIPDVLILADEGWLVQGSPDDKVPLGSHGFDNDLPSMRGIFLARGPAFHVGLNAPALDAIDIYELLTQVLLLRSLPSDGSYDRVRFLMSAPSITGEASGL